jgi:hypothetical protein
LEGNGCFAFSPDGRILATGGGVLAPARGAGLRGLSPNIRLWDLPTGKELRHWKWENEDGPVLSLAFSPDGKTLLAGGRRQARLWEIASGQIRWMTNEQEAPHFTVAFAPNGRTFATSNGENKISLWDALGAGPWVPPTAEDLETSWDELASDDAAESHRTMGVLAHWPEPAVPFLQKRLQPVPTTQTQKIAQLIAELDSNQFAARRKATEDLEKLADAAKPALQQLLARKPSLEVRQRAERLLAKLRAAPISGERLRVLRAIEVLEYIGTPAVRPILESLARGAPEDRLTQEAKASLERLTKRWAAVP